jgi:hypothetical protein
MCRNQDIQIELIDSIPQLERVGAEWDLLCLEAPQGLPMLSHAMVISYFEHRLSARNSWFCLLAFQSGRLIGVLPLVKIPIRLGIIRYLMLCTPWDEHHRSGDILLARTDEKLVSSICEKMIAEAFKMIPKAIAIEFRGVRNNSPFWNFGLMDCSRFVIFKEADSGGRFIKVEGTFEDFQASLSKNFRSNLRKTRKKLSTVAGGHAEFLRGNEASVQEFPKFLDLEASGWKGKAGTAIKCAPELVRHYSSLVRRFRDRGWLEWHFLKVHEHIIAGHLAVRMGPNIILLKIAYDEAFSACAPGNHLFEQMLKWAFANGEIKEINCLTDMEWHKNWRMENSPYYKLTIYQRKPLSFLYGIFPKLTLKVAQNTWSCLVGWFINSVM